MTTQFQLINIIIIIIIYIRSEVPATMSLRETLG